MRHELLEEFVSHPLARDEVEDDHGHHVDDDGELEGDSDLDEEEDDDWP